MVTVFSCPQSGKDVYSALTMWHDMVVHKFHAGELPGRVTEKLWEFFLMSKSVYSFVLLFIHSYPGSHTPLGHELDTWIRGSSFTWALVSAMKIYNMWAVKVAVDSRYAFGLVLPWFKLHWRTQRRMESEAWRDSCAKVDEGATEKFKLVTLSLWIINLKAPEFIFQLRNYEAARKEWA